MRQPSPLSLPLIIAIVACACDAEVPGGGDTPTTTDSTAGTTRGGTQRPDTGSSTTGTGVTSEATTAPEDGTATESSSPSSSSGGESTDTDSGSSTTDGQSPRPTGRVVARNNFLPLTLEPGEQNFSLFADVPEYFYGCSVETIDQCRVISCGPDSEFPLPVSVGDITFTGFPSPYGSISLVFDDPTGFYGGADGVESLWAGGEEIAITVDDSDPPVVLNAPPPLIVTEPPLKDGSAPLEIDPSEPLSVAWELSEGPVDGSFIRVVFSTQQGLAFNSVECDAAADANSTVIGTDALEPLYPDSPFSLVTVSHTVEGTQETAELDIVLELSEFASTPSGDKFRPSIVIVE